MHKRLKPQIPTTKIVATITVMHFTNLGSLNSLSQTISLNNLKKKIPSVSTITRVTDNMDIEETRGVGIEIYAKDGKSFEDKLNRANWMWTCKSALSRIRIFG